MIREMLEAMRRGDARGSRVRFHHHILGRTEPRLRIVIDTIPHSRQRYPTVGDWQIDKAGNLHITI